MAKTGSFPFHSARLKWLAFNDTLFVKPFAGNDLFPLCVIGRLSGDKEMRTRKCTFTFNELL
jgi:hypothetical protein